LVPSGPGAKLHLFAVLIDPVVVEGYGKNQHVLMVSFCSIRPGLIYEDCCLLDVGDHPFVEHPSYVDYRLARLEQTSHVEARVKEGVFLPKEPCSPELLRRVVAGALKSRRIPREFKLVLERVVWGC